MVDAPHGSPPLAATGSSTETPSDTAFGSAPSSVPGFELLRCPQTGGRLERTADGLYSPRADVTYPLSESGIPLFAEVVCSGDAAVQKRHYDRIAGIYVDNVGYPHTREYMRMLDDALLDVVRSDSSDGSLGVVAEICCGKGEAFDLIPGRSTLGLGVDVSRAMLEEGRTRLPDVLFIQADAVKLPLADASVDTVFMLGGIHHVNDRRSLFGEIHRVLQPGGAFYFREPLDDFVLWRALRAVIYRLSPTLDHDTERPLRRRETVAALEAAGLGLRHWRSHGFLGFCIFMNSDVLVFNRLFRFVPFIRPITRAFARLDEALLRIPGLRSAGLQVVGVAEKAR